MTSAGIRRGARLVTTSTGSLLRRASGEKKMKARLSMMPAAATEAATTTSLAGIAMAFEALCHEGKFEEAAEQLADNFCFNNPIQSLDKEQWKEDFPKLFLKEQRPNFKSFEQKGSDDSMAISRKGMQKFGKKLHISVNETWMFTKDGKIRLISASSL